MTSLNPTPDGVLLVDKAEGMTSHDVVALIRRKLGIKKVGHCGTLDPIATGLLLLTLGRGTKIQDLLMSEDKEYAGTLLLGVTTSTQDRQGEVVNQRDVPPLDEIQIRAALRNFAAISIRCRQWSRQKNMAVCLSTNWRAREKWSSASRASFMSIVTVWIESRCRRSISAFFVAKVFMFARMCMTSARSSVAART